MKCEECGNEHDGSYGSGRFCSEKCRMSWIAKQGVLKRDKNWKSPFSNPKNKRNKKAPFGTWKCEVCDFIAETKNEKYVHIRKYHPETLIRHAWNKGLTKYTDKRVNQGCESKRKKYENGELIPSFTGKHHTQETKEKLSRAQRSLSVRRKCKKTVPYIRKDGSVVLVDSSYEIKLAKILDENNIEWIRPDPIPWLDVKGKTHFYFPDFYLTDYDIYLDPKNDYCFVQQSEKISYFTKNYKNIFFLRKEQLTKEHVNSLIGRYISWLDSRSDKAKVVGSSPTRPTKGTKEQWKTIGWRRYARYW